MSPRRPKYELVTIGDATQDIIVGGADTRILTQRGRKYLAYPYGEKVHLQNAAVSYGGGAANVAVGAARLGVKTAFCGSVGRDAAGQDILAHFKSEGVAVSLVVRDPADPSPVALVLTAPDGERTILLHDGANRDLGSEPIDWSKLFDTAWLYLPSLPGPADALYNRLARTAGRNGTKVALNPGTYQIRRGTRGLHAALERCDVLLLNDDEARTLLRQRKHAARTIPQMLKKLHAITGGIVIITTGARGAAATDGNEVYTIPAFSARRVNAVGAGDAFGSTAVTALIKSRSLADALVLASINASAVVANQTAQDGLCSWAHLLKQFRAAPRFRPTVSRLPQR